MRQRSASRPREDLSLRVLRSRCASSVRGWLCDDEGGGRFLRLGEVEDGNRRAAGAAGSATAAVAMVQAGQGLEEEDDCALCGRGRVVGAHLSRVSGFSFLFAGKEENPAAAMILCDFG